MSTLFSNGSVFCSSQLTAATLTSPKVRWTYDHTPSAPSPKRGRGGKSLSPPLLKARSTRRTVPHHSLVVRLSTACKLGIHTPGCYSTIPLFSFKSLEGLFWLELRFVSFTVIQVETNMEFHAITTFASTYQALTLMWRRSIPHLNFPNKYPAIFFQNWCLCRYLWMGWENFYNSSTDVNIATLHLKIPHYK